MDYFDIILILITVLMWLFSIIKSLKHMILINSKKPYLIDKKFELYQLGNYALVVILIPFWYLIITNWDKYTHLTFNVVDIHKLLNLGLYTSATVAALFGSTQKKSLWSGGIFDPSAGVFLWEEVVGYSIVQEGPYEFDQLYPWWPNKYILTFTLKQPIKSNGNPILSWKVKESFANKIKDFLNENLPHLESNPPANGN